MVSAVTFLFTDIEGSTRLWEEHPEAMQQALEWHDRVALRVVERHGGKVFKTVGDAFYAVFPSTREAVEAAVEGQRKLSIAEETAGFPLRVRMAVHTGPAQERDGDYFGASLNRLARVLSMGSGGQVLLTRSARESLLLTPPVEGTMLVDLGVHRLRDVAQPEHVFELRIEGLSDNSQAPRSLASYPNNLPIQISSFVGREKELSDCRRLLRDGRLVTLTGVGGSGKSRLALQLASELLGPDGAYLVELAPLQSTAIVDQSIGDALGLRETADRPILDAVTEFLRTRRTLIVLDNCEHMVEEAASTVSLLLQRCPLLKVLATSREALGVPGEDTFKVPPLALPMSDNPPVEELAGFEAVRLFVDRAASAKGGFGLTSANAATVLEICRQLEGIPLAIELAAARVRSMSLEQICERLHDQFRLLSAGSRGVIPRQQTLRALVDWSYDLLTAEEKLLLDRLSVFVSGWTLEAAEQVCVGDSLNADNVLDTLSRLVDKSLVQYDDRSEERSRYRLLETIRQYAAQRLEERGETCRTGSAHLSYFSTLAKSARPHLQSGDREWIERVSREHDNIRAALDHCESSPENTELALSLAAAMTVFWNNRGHLTEGRSRFRKVLSHASDAPANLRAEALLGAAVLESSLGFNSQAVDWAEEAVQVWRSYRDERMTAFGLVVLGNIRIQLRDLEGAAREYDEGMRLLLKLGDSARMAIPLNNLGYIAYQRGEYGKAQRMIEEAIRIGREVGNRQIVVNATHSLAMVFKDLNQLDKALEWMRESLMAAADLQHHVPIALRIEGIAYVLDLLGDDREAARLLGASSALRRMINFPVPSLELPHHVRHENSLRDKLGDRFDAEFLAGAQLSEDGAIALALGSHVSVR